MYCGFGCGGNGPSKYSPEYQKKQKLENNAGCSCSGNGRNDCNEPSLAREGSPRWQWEQKYGKLVTKIIHTTDEQGHETVTVLKTPCPAVQSDKVKKTCCSFNYRVNR